MLQVSQKSLYAHLFPYVCVYRENTIKRELEVALMCPSFRADFIALKGEILGLICPIFIPSTFLGVISRVNLPHTLALSDLLHHDFQNF